MSPELKALLFKILDTPSATANLAGVCKVQAQLASRLAALGFKVRY
jgi:hypothetical protein